MIVEVLVFPPKDVPSPAAERCVLIGVTLRSNVPCGTRIGRVQAAARFEQQVCREFDHTGQLEMSQKRPRKGLSKLLDATNVNPKLCDATFA